jgi:hypothetical protein
LRDQNRLRDEAQIGALLSEEVLAILPRLVGHDKPSTKLLTRMFHEWPTATTDMAVLPGVLGCSFDRLRTSSPCDVPFRYASDLTPCGCPVAPPVFMVSLQQFTKHPG